LYEINEIDLPEVNSDYLHENNWFRPINICWFPQEKGG